MRPALGQLHERRVADDGAHRPVLGGGGPLPPGRELPGDRPLPRVEARDARQAPPDLVGIALVRRLLDRPALLARPLQPAGLAQAALQVVGEGIQVLDVLARVAELLGRQRPGVPAGEGRRLREPDPQDVVEEPGVARLGGEAGEPRRDLGVEDVGERGAPRAPEDRHVLAAGVEHDLHRRVGEHGGQRGGIAEIVLDRVEQHDLVPDRDLHEAEQRAVAALGQELRVDAEPARLAGARGDPRELRHRAPSPSAPSRARPACRRPRRRAPRRPSGRARRSRRAGAAHRGTR